MAEALPGDFVPRTPELEIVVSRLVDERHDPIATAVALVGAGGFGKTTLARATCHDQRVRAAFDDGVVWVKLGEKPRDVVGHVLDVVEAVSGERPTFTTLPAAVSRLSEVLADRYVLLVLDDVWNRAHLEPFLAGGADCARLITTREVDALPERVQIQGLEAMRTAEATALLTWQLPAIEQADATALADHLGGWPLLLKLTNGALRGYIREGKSPANALVFADQALTRRGLLAFDSANPAAREQAVAATLAASLELLTEEEQSRFARLAVIPDDLAAPINMLRRLWGTDDFETEEFCRKLANHSLVLAFDGASVRVHDVVRKFLRGKHRNEVAIWHAQLLDQYTERPSINALERCAGRRDVSALPPRAPSARRRSPRRAARTVRRPALDVEAGRVG